MLRKIAFMAGAALLAAGVWRWLGADRLRPLRAPETPLATRVLASPNFGVRRGLRPPDMILLHYTGMADCEAAARWLADPSSRVSAHYLIDETGAITQMVSEAHRAWHAGVSFWAGETDINSASIGIEIHNWGHDGPGGLPPYPRAQMDAVAALCRDIAGRWNVPPERVLAHSDVAPGRKRDPGEHFDWQWLSKRGVGIWVPPAPLADDPGFGVGDEGEGVADVKAKLARIGYAVSDGPVMDAQTETVIVAFQRRFRPARIDGRADASTRETLGRLVAILDGEVVG